MGLTKQSMGRGAVDNSLKVTKLNGTDKIIALAGNPNVGKSTVFNALTGLKQHTGNWPGKTVATAQGTHRFEGVDYILVDLPGSYSLMAHSAEEEIARDFILLGGADATIVVCDATCLERNMNLVLQTMEITPNVVCCINLMDEAQKRGIEPDLKLLKENLGIPVVATSARSGEGLSELMQAVKDITEEKCKTAPKKIRYSAVVEDALAEFSPILEFVEADVKINSRWLLLRLLSGEDLPIKGLREDPAIASRLEKAESVLRRSEITPEILQDRIAKCTVLAAEEVCMGVFPHSCRTCDASDRKLDKILTSKLTGLPIMLTLLCIIFWITITGANYPSQLLSSGLFWIQDRLTNFFTYVNAPDWLHGSLVLGVYRTLAWVVSVMLPPMAIFFPLFTLLEDFGYLPRVAFNLDHQFKKAKTCGKQALTMCMGFGCNAAGVTGCRIIDSPRERLIAILTNNFVPCNGRFPTLIAIISMFFIGATAGVFRSLLSSLILLVVILLGIMLTFAVSWFLSATLLRGEPSSFTLELPPYRTPQFGKVLIRSLLDRTLFVLGRAASVAAPAGLIIWLFANIMVGDISLLNYLAGLLDPFARLLGMDGVILLAFILGFPANEIVVPIIIMAYMSTNSLAELSGLSELRSLLVANGWTWVTAASTMLFCLIHWPCSTTCLTIKKETGSFKWTALSILIPTVIGMSVCFLFTFIVNLKY